MTNEYSLPTDPGWKSTVVISDLLEAHRAKKLSVQQIATEIATRLKKNKFEHCLELRFCIDDFENLAQDPETTVDDFDEILERVYDFADIGRRIWIDGF